MIARSKLGSQPLASERGEIPAAPLSSPPRPRLRHPPIPFCTHRGSPDTGVCARRPGEQPPACSPLLCRAWAGARSADLSVPLSVPVLSLSRCPIVSGSVTLVSFALGESLCPLPVETCICLCVGGSGILRSISSFPPPPVALQKECNLPNLPPTSPPPPHTNLSGQTCRLDRQAMGPPRRPPSKNPDLSPGPVVAFMSGFCAHEVDRVPFFSPAEFLPIQLALFLPWPSSRNPAESSFSSDWAHLNP